MSANTGVIKQLRDVGTNKNLYPVTSESAVRDENGNTLTSKLGMIEDELSGKTSSTEFETEVAKKLDVTENQGLTEAQKKQGRKNLGLGETIDTVPTSGSTNLVESGGVFKYIADNTGAFDITAYNSGATYSGLTQALNAVPVQFRKGGMSVRYVPTSDNKYVSYANTSSGWTNDDSWWTIDEDTYEIDNQEFTEVHTDSDDRVTYGVKSNGDFYFGIGVPGQVQYEINKQANKKVDKEDGKSLMSSEEHNKLEALPTNTELNSELESKVNKVEGKGLSTEDYTTSEKAKLDSLPSASGLTAELLSKVDKVEGETLIDGNFADTVPEIVSAIENSEFMSVETDSDERVVGGRMSDGSRFENCDVKIHGNLTLNTAYVSGNVTYKQIPTQIKDYADTVSADHVDICVPDTINAVVGDTLQLYYKSIFKCVEFSNYDINILGDIGKQFPRYYELTPLVNQVGEHTITFKIKDSNNNLISEKSCTLNIVSGATSPSSNINVLCVGASETTGGQWVAEFKRRLVGTGGTPAGNELTNITFVGRKNQTVDGVQANFEATGGYAYGSYTSTTGRLHKFYFTSEKPAGELSVGNVYTYQGNEYTVTEINLTDNVGNISCTGAADPTGTNGTLTKISGEGSNTLVFATCDSSGNPFVYNGVVDMQQYANDYCNGSIDVIYVAAFANATSPYKFDFTNNFTSMQAFIDQCRSAFPSVKVCVALVYNPDVRGGMGVNYGTDGTWSLAYGMKYTFMNLCNALQNYINERNLGDYVYIVNWLNEFDEENDFKQTTKQVNVRSQVTEIFGVNGMHPSDIGYLQMADTCYRLFVSKFCQ